MSGPPPCTTIGVMPTYLSSTTSRAKSSVNPASVIAAPPILITTVFSWNSRIHGSASRSVATSLNGSPSRRVLRVDRHVLVREVREEDLGLAALARDRERELDLAAGHRLLEVGELRRIEGVAVAGRDHAAALDLEVDHERWRQHRTGGLEDAAIVGVRAVQGRLDERRVGDRTRHRLDVVRAPAHDHAADPLRALAVGHHLDRELAHQRVHGLAQEQLVGALRLDLDTPCP